MSKNNPAVQLAFKMDKVEKAITLIITLVFVLAMTDMTSIPITIGLFVFGVVVFVYYFIWYRKKSPTYVQIGDKRMTICIPPFFHSREIDRQQIEQIDIGKSSLKIQYREQETSGNIRIFSVMLSDEDWAQLTEILKPQTKE